MPVWRQYFVPKKDIPPHVIAAVSITVAVAAAAGWCLLTYGGVVRSTFFPAPHSVLVTGYKMLADGSLLDHTLTSVSVIFTGFTLASIVAVPLGIISGSFRIVRAAVDPIVNFMRYLPVTAFIPLLILWIGIGFEEKVAVIVLGTFFQQLVLVSNVSASVSQDLIDVSYTLGAKKVDVIAKVLVPATMPGVVDSLRVTMGWAWTYLVVAELVAANSGLGYMILNAMRGLFTDRIFLGILVIGLLGLITDQTFRIIRKIALPWANEVA